ncbi:MAG: CDP-diacylglycerol--glycerol-3-phosphate 3-phosphatidyltransferase [Oscillospiraceae bacterium]|nr:CDP-diacylglycerol--glycerol-3-phosphate 3-phosphatidyltransferase [Oscillospiraceae bacterium]
MNTANKLTMVRILLIPAFLAVLYIGFTGNTYVAMGIFIVAGLTDIADGYIARKRNLVTDFGKLMDPLADKILVLSAMLWFLEQGIMPAWVVLIVVVREFLVTALRLIAADTGRVIAAGISGKIKTVVTMACLTIMFLNLPPWAVIASVVAITVTTVFSGVEYFIKNKDVFNWKKI